MPFLQQITLPNESLIGIWEITETLSELEAFLGNAIQEPSKNTFQKEIHHLQWYASRLLLKHFFNSNAILLTKDQFNKPQLLIDNKPFAISITHAGKYAAIFVSPTLDVGIDLEKIDERILQLTHKFSSEEELTFIAQANQQQASIATLIWSAKETIYKLYGKKSLDFKKNIHIHQIKNPLLGGVTKGELAFTIDIHYFFIENFIITYASR